MLHTQAPDITDRVHSASLIVDIHQPGIRPQEPLQGCQGHTSVFLNRDVPHIKPLFGEALSSPQDTVVLHGGHQNVCPPNPFQVLLHSPKHQVVGLASSRREDDTAVAGAHEVGYLRPCALQRLVRRTSKLIQCTGVSILGRQVRHH